VRKSDVWRACTGFKLGGRTFASGYLKHFRSNWPTTRFWGPVWIGLIQTDRRLFALIGGLLRIRCRCRCDSCMLSCWPVVLTLPLQLKRRAEVPYCSVCLRSHRNTILQSFQENPDLSPRYGSCHTRINTKALLQAVRAAELYVLCMSTRFQSTKGQQ